MKTDDFYAGVTAQIITAMKEHGTDWTKSWASIGANRNAISGHIYSGINTLITGMASCMKGYSDPRWLTYNQANAASGQVRKGERSIKIMVMKQLTKEDPDGGKDKRMSFARSFSVFNVAQVDGLDIPPFEIPDMNGGADVDSAADKLAESTGIKIQHGGPSAFYQPSIDRVQMPPKSWFIEDKASDATGHYYSVLFHELTHATGHKSRLDRLKGSGFGTKDYAFEELIAEIGAVMACIHLGIANEPRADHAQYLNSWISRLEENPQTVFHAAARAQAAVKWMIAQETADKEIAA